MIRHEKRKTDDFKQNANKHADFKYFLTFTHQTYPT